MNPNQSVLEYVYSLALEVAEQGHDEVDVILTTNQLRDLSAVLDITASPLQLLPRGLTNPRLVTVNIKVEPTYVWVITISYRYDYGIYRIYTDETVARASYDELIAGGEWANPTLDKWKLDMPVDLKEGEKCFRQILPPKRDDIPFSKYPWEE